MSRPEPAPATPRGRAVRIVRARVVLPDAIVEDASVVLRDGRIDGFDGGAGLPEEDFGGDLLVPGLIDIHTDALEKHFMPRPGSPWDAVGAAVAHDGALAAAGVTTVLDSLSLHGHQEGLDRREALPALIGGLDDARASGLLRIDHQLHLRCEVSFAGLLEALEPWVGHPALGMLSVMDHTPGQGQMRDLEKLRSQRRAAGEADADIEAHWAAAQAAHDPESAAALRRAVAGVARDRGLPFASHDDVDEADVAFAAALGATIAEFPCTAEAARAARLHGLVNVMGAPNLVRGASHSGNVSARALAAADLVDALCSDYVPQSMVRGAFLLAEPPLSWSLPRALATVTAAPARMAGLDDRGRIEPGLRADLLRIDARTGPWPAIRETWCAGRRVA